MNMRSPTAARVFDINEVEEDIEQALRQAPPRALPATALMPLHPPAVPIPLPDYVEPRDGVGDVGRLTAEVVVREFETAAKEIEAMGEELKARVAKMEATKVDAVAVMEEIKETAARFRDEAKRVFLQIEDVAMMTSEVRATCTALKAKIAGPSS